MTDRALLQQALEALDYEAERSNDAQAWLDIRVALRDRLAQPEQEPVAVIGNWGRVEWRDGVYPQLGDKMYAAPPQSKPEQEMCDVLRLAQDALQMACAPFPVDEIKTMRALQAVTKLLTEMEQK